MKIVAFDLNGAACLGVVDGEEVINLHAVDDSLPDDMAEVLAGRDGDLSFLSSLVERAPAAARLPLAGLSYDLPVRRPGKIVCLGLNYLDHVKERPNFDDVPKFPTIFMRCRTSLVAHGKPIMRPKVSETLDYEAELILIIGKRAKHLTLENATSVVAGYAVGNEGSIREFQRKTAQWDMGKNFDATGGVGPWMVTVDELADAAKGLKIETRLNGTTLQSDNTDNMMFPVRELLAYITQGMTLEPGDVIFTGTPSGIGGTRKPEPIWMRPGDVCEVEIEGIGILRNPIELEA